MARKRTAHGTMMAEFPAAIWVLLVLISMPMIGLASSTLESTFIVCAALDAAHCAACSKSFQTSVDATDPSAVQAAQSQVSQYFQDFAGITLNSVGVNIVATNISSGATTRQNYPLTQPPNTNSYIYSLEVVISASANPLIACGQNWLPGVPGLSAPVPITYRTQQFAEFPQGLTQ